MKSKALIVAMLRVHADAVREAGLKADAEKHITKLEALLDSPRDLDVALASIMAMIEITRPLMFEVLANEASGYSIKAKRYLELESEKDGKKKDIAAGLGVSTQALHVYEKKYAKELRQLRDWRDETRAKEILMRRVPSL